MDIIKPEGVTIKQMILHKTDDSSFVVVGLGSDDRIYIYERSTSTWEDFSSV